jgi:hypothetical protein
MPNDALVFVSDTFQAYEDFEHYLKSKNVYEDFHVFVRVDSGAIFSQVHRVNNMHLKMLQVIETLEFICSAAKSRPPALKTMGPSATVLTGIGSSAVSI